MQRYNLRKKAVLSQPNKYGDDKEGNYVYATGRAMTDGITRLLYRAPYCDIILAVRFGGYIVKEALEAALSRVKAKYPLLSAGFIQDEKGDISFAYGCDRPIPITPFENRAENDWLSLAWEEQKIPFDMRRGPLAKVLLIHTNESTDVVIICHHCISDGLSLTYLAKDIAAYLEEPAVEPQPFPAPPAISAQNMNVDMKPGISGGAIKFFAGILNRSWNKSKVIFTEQDYAQLYKEYWKAKDIGIIPFCLPKGETAALIEKCHANGVTVNSALTSALSVAQCELQGRGRRYLRKALLAMNIRGLFKADPGENIGLLAAGNEITLPPVKGGFWDAAKKINARIKRMLANPKKSLALVAPLGYIEPTLLDAVYFAESGNFCNKPARRLKNIILSKSGKPKRSIDITNLGVIKNTCRNLKNVFLIPILSGNYEKTVGIVTINGEMNITMMYDRAVISREAMENFKRKFVSVIDAACEWTS